MGIEVSGSNLRLSVKVDAKIDTGAIVGKFIGCQPLTIIENIFQDADWAILEWRDPLGLRGCGFFKIENEKIVFQRGYWDKLSFLRQHDLPIPTE